MIHRWPVAQILETFDLLVDSIADIFEEARHDPVYVLCLSVTVFGAGLLIALAIDALGVAS